MEFLTGNIGSTFTVEFPNPVPTSVCAESEGVKSLIVCDTTMTVETTPGSVTPSSGEISTSSITTFTIVGSGTLTLRPTAYVACAGGGCEPLTIVITAVGPKSLVSSNCESWDGLDSSDASISGHIGETFTVTFPNLIVAVGSVGAQSLGCANYSFVSDPGTTSPASGIIATTDPTTFTITGPGTIMFTMLAPLAAANDSILRPRQLPITVSVLPDDPPPDVLQQVGAPSTGTCATFTDSTLNWAGAPSGGWGMSWAQWVNQGRGGAVCTRSLYWLPSGQWTVRA